MSHDDTISIACTTCANPVHFHLHTIEQELPCISSCSQCGKKYGIECGTVSRQIMLFTALCRQLKKSEEILSSAAIAVSIGKEEVSIPFKILLSRLRSTLDLEIDGTKITVSYRTNPLGVASSLELLDTLSEESKPKFSSTL